jgi:hypothetical protein
MSMTLEFVCEGCGKKERQEIGGYAHTLPAMGHIPRNWGYMTIHSPLSPCPNQASPGFPVIITRHWVVCSQECLEKLLARIYKAEEWKRSP